MFKLSTTQCVIEAILGDDLYAKYRAVEMPKEFKHMYSTLIIFVGRAIFGLGLFSTFMFILFAFEIIFFGSIRSLDFITSIFTLTEAEKEIAAIEDIFFAVMLLFFIYA